MTRTIGVVMDPISDINIKKDSTFAMMLEAQRRGHDIYIMQQNDLFVESGKAQAHTVRVSVQDDSKNWYNELSEQTISLSDCDAILMRKDPPFDIEYIYSTYILELAEAEGVLIVNKPQSLRDYNEKLATLWFPDCCPKTLVTRDAARLEQFHQTHKDVIFKPLEGMGGSNVFRLKENDVNLNVIIENLTDSGRRYIMAQQFIPDISQGDKRILVIDGVAVPYGLARVPKEGETRGNLAAGASAHGIELSKEDKKICERVGPILKEKGLLFVGLDVIGDYLTEINITSPTCIRELDTLFNLNISGLLFDAIERRLS